MKYLSASAGCFHNVTTTYIGLISDHFFRSLNAYLVKEFVRDVIFSVKNYLHNGP